MRRLLTFTIFALAANSALADDGVRSIDITGPSRETVRNAIVRELSKTGDLRLVDETYFRLIFEQDAKREQDKPLYQTSEPVDRFTFTVADLDHGVQVSADVIHIENAGSSFERRTTLRFGQAAEESHSILAAVAASFAEPSMKSATR